MIMDLWALHRVDWQTLDLSERATWAAWYEVQYAGGGR